jgi:hypothetical protein
MTKTFCSVVGNIGHSQVVPNSALHSSEATDPAELEETVLDGTVIADVVLRLLSECC